MATTSGSGYTALWSLQGEWQSSSRIWGSSPSARGSIYAQAARPGSEAPTAPQPPKAKGGVLGFAGDVFVGAGEAVADTLVGAGNLVFHPLKTLSHLARVPLTLVTRPSTLVAAFTEPYREALKEGRKGKAIGRGLAEVGLLVFGTTLVSGVAKVGTGAAVAGQVAVHGVKLAEASSTVAPKS
jgi:hypothetical protein